jgi:hypothetical protein
MHAPPCCEIDKRSLRTAALLRQLGHRLTELAVLDGELESLFATVETEVAW